MALPTEFQHLIDSASTSVYTAWAQYCDAARVGFGEKRRGTFLIDLDQPLPNASDTPYLTTEEASAELGFDGSNIAIMSRVGTYDPEREFVVTFKCTKHGYAQCLVLRAPPDEYKDIQIVTDQPDPSVAESFDQLLDILNDIYFRCDIEAMDTSSRHVWRLMEANWQIQSNGFDGYFYNVGTESRELLAALDAVKSPVLQSVFSPVFALFPDGKPSPDTDEFYSQIDTITDKDEDAFENHDSAFYEIDSQLPDILWAYWQSSRTQTA